MLASRFLLRFLWGWQIYSGLIFIATFTRTPNKFIFIYSNCCEDVFCKGQNQVLRVPLVILLMRNQALPREWQTLSCINSTIFLPRNGRWCMTLQRCFFIVSIIGNWRLQLQGNNSCLVMKFPPTKWITQGAVLQQWIFEKNKVFQPKFSTVYF